MGQDDVGLERFNELTRRIIGCAYDVGNGLGVGFLEKVYENALAHELRKAGLDVEQQKQIEVHYDGIVVGQYVADLVVNDLVLIELKAVKAFDNVHLAQCINYLKATGMKLCLLMNFGTPRVEIKRIAN
ncbi:MAG: GxxExxY protein [Planctomycetes bacterium RBG_13_63_9]|nr:MAG: GxxExxY protein [Planctomycetes bacterium RBG_13_63_9]